MQIARRHARMPASLAVTVSSVLDTIAATVTDVSEGGAQVSCETQLAQGTRIWISHEAKAYYGTVAWTEIDRMGIRFDHPTSGLLDAARQAAYAAMTAAPAARPGATFGRRLLAA